MKETVTVHCGHEGCREVARYEVYDRKEAKEIRECKGNGKWRCTRHSNPDSVLSPQKKKTISIQIAGKSKTYPDLTDLYWNDESGFVYGPGFKAFANDFPEGTKLIVTAEIVLPKAQ